MMSKGRGNYSSVLHLAFFYALEYIISTFSRTASQTNRR